MAIEQIVFADAKQEGNGCASEHQERDRCNAADAVPSIDEECRADCSDREEKKRQGRSIRHDGRSIDAITERTQEKDRQFRWKETIGPWVARITEPELQTKSQQQVCSQDQRNHSQRASDDEGSQQ